MTPSVWNDEDLLSVLRVEAHRLGEAPRREAFAVATADRPHYRTFANRFGSWTQALQAAGLIGAGMTWRDLSGPPSWPREDLLRILVEKARHLDRIPLRDDFPRQLGRHHTTEPLLTTSALGRLPCVRLVSLAGR
jgi:hypothetical protein